MLVPFLNSTNAVLLAAAARAEPARWQEGALGEAASGFVFVPDTLAPLSIEEVKRSLARKTGASEAHFEQLFDREREAAVHIVVPLRRRFEQNSRIGSASGAVAVAEPYADPLDVAAPFGVDLHMGVEADVPRQNTLPLYAVVLHFHDRGEESSLTPKPSSSIADRDDLKGASRSCGPEILATSI